jgi:Replication-relaxation
MAAVRRSYPRFEREREAPRVDLTDDDVAIIRCVYRHRFVRADDVYRLFPSRSADRLSRRLTLLYRAGLLDRPVAQIDRFRKGGSQAFVYGLDTAGARLLKERFGVPIGVADWRSRNRSYTRENLDHTIAVSRFLVDMELASRALDDLTYVAFEDILRKAPEETRRSPYPGRWPVEVYFYGARGTVHLAPDAIFGLRHHRPDGTSRSSYFFLEIDRGTMTIAPSERVRESDAFIHRSTILRKLAAYAESWRQELHKRQFGFAAPRMLMLTTSVTRAEAMRRTAAELIQAAHAIPTGAMLFGHLPDGENPFGVALSDVGGGKVLLVPELPTAASAAPK